MQISGMISTNHDEIGLVYKSFVEGFELDQWDQWDQWDGLRDMNLTVD